jgi:hypothetical protein
MKIPSLMIVIAFTLGSALATASETVISDTTTEIELDLNTETVQCLVGDYGANSLKIVVPQIKHLAYLDHTSRGAPGPCINAGFCKSSPDSTRLGQTTDYRLPALHDVNKPTEIVQLRVVKKEVADISNGRCVRGYKEEVSATVRGTQFYHQAQIPLASLPLDQCN